MGKILAMKPVSLSLIRKNHMVETDEQLQEVVL